MVTSTACTEQVFMYVMLKHLLSEILWNAGADGNVAVDARRWQPGEKRRTARARCN